MPTKLRTFLAILISLVLVSPTAWAASSKASSKSNSSGQDAGGGPKSGGGGGATLHIGFGAGTPCAVGCGGDPNVSGTTTASSTFDISQTSDGHPVVNPVLLIIGVPNQTDPALFNQNSMIALTSINPYPSGTGVGSNTWTYGTTDFGLGSDVGFGSASGYRGEFTASFHGDVYSFLGLEGGNNSNNWTNWYGADLANTGIDASGFGLYVFNLHADLGPKGLLNIGFDSDSTVPVGSYLIAYATGSVLSTPFTEAGLYNTPGAGSEGIIPEPGTLLLLGSGLAGLGAWIQRRSRREGC